MGSETQTAFFLWKRGSANDTKIRSDKIRSKTMFPNKFSHNIISILFDNC